MFHPFKDRYFSKELSDELSVSFLVIHHLRKTKSNDRFDDISGTFGITGAADGALILLRKAGEFIGELHTEGRDIKSNEYAIKFNCELLAWNILGGADEIKSTDKKQQIFDTIKNNGGNMTLKQIVEESGLYQGYVSKMINSLMSEGSIIRVKRGIYRYDPQSHF